MKRIALFVHNLTVDYSLSVAQGVASYFTQDKDVKLIVAQTNQPSYPYGLYEYQYWAGAKLLQADDIDLIMIVTSAYQTYIREKDLLNYLKPFTNKPIVSIAVDLPFSNVHYTVSDCYKAYDKVVEHLITQHGCKNIGFISAAKTESKEAVTRLDAFKKALKNHKLEFNPDNVIEGYFIREASYNIALEKFKSKKDITFDALISANDLMAEGVMKALQQNGIKIPKDVKIVGFDDTVRASFTSPSLSTIDQYIAGQGYEAAKLAHKILKGEKVPRETKVFAEPIYRQSCGCIKTSNTAFINRTQEGKLLPNAHINSQTIEDYTESSK